MEGREGGKYRHLFGNSNRTYLHMVSFSSLAAPPNSVFPQEIPEEDLKGKHAFQAGWLNDLVTKVSFSFFCDFKKSS